MMGHREPLKGGDEYDALTRARCVYGPTAGVVRKVKRQFWKRIRSKVRNAMRRLRS